MRYAAAEVLHDQKLGMYGGAPSSLLMEAYVLVIAWILSRPGTTVVHRTVTPAAMPCDLVLIAELALSSPVCCTARCILGCCPTLLSFCTLLLHYGLFHTRACVSSRLVPTSARHTCHRFPPASFRLEQMRKERVGSQTSSLGLSTLHPP